VLLCVGISSDDADCAANRQKRRATWAPYMAKELLTHFAADIRALSVPGKQRCEQYLTEITRYDISNLTWIDVKNKINAAVQKQKRKK
jgi:hypothetical protein